MAARGQNSGAVWYHAGSNAITVHPAPALARSDDTTRHNHEVNS